MNYTFAFLRAVIAHTVTPQARTVLEHLLSNDPADGELRSITSVEAEALYRIRRLASRISELAEAGVEITRVHKKDRTGQRYVRYSLSR